MTKALRMIKNSSEGKSYIHCKCVFVSVNPKSDTTKHLTNFKNLYGNELLVARADSAESNQLQSMLKAFRVPCGLNDEEKKKVEEYFA